MTLLNSNPLVLDKKLAVILGLNEALVLEQIHYWLEVNKKEKRNYHEGRYWTYNTLNEWQEEFPFWSISTIKRIFKKLRDMKILEVGNFNVYQMDRTLWYTINYEELDKLCQGELNRDGFTCEETGKENVDEDEGIKGEVQNDQSTSSSRESHNTQNGQMERVNKTTAIPENTTDISADISNSSISQSGELESGINYSKIDGQVDGFNKTHNRIKDKYEKIICNCELYGIEERYREAVAHAIKLLVLDAERNNSIKIGNRYIPAHIVRDDIGKLNFFIVEYAINKYKEISSIQKIRNPLEYLKSLLYNSINEMQIDIDSKLRYDNLI